MAQQLCWLGVLAVAEGKHERGARLLGAGAAVDPRFATMLIPDLRVEAAQMTARARSVLGEDAFSAAWAEGQAMTLEEAVEYAFGENDDAGQAPGPVSAATLTSIGQEVPKNIPSAGRFPEGAGDPHRGVGPQS